MATTFKVCPIADSLVETCENNERCDVCAAICLPVGIFIDAILILPRWLYSCF